VPVDPQAFDEGGWSTDVQFMDVMGSPYLIAHGRGVRVVDAKAVAELPFEGEWRVWVRSRKWVDGAGAFRVSVNGRDLGRTFGVSQPGWEWEDGGSVSAGGRVELRLRDMDGFDGRCAGIVLASGGARPAGPLCVGDRPVAETVDADFVVVGGGLPGTCAAVAAARRGLRVALVQDRPVLGGNASSEIRVWCGGEARYPLVRELRGMFMNRDGNAALSDARRARIVDDEPNVATYLKHRMFAAETNGAGVVAVKALDWGRNRVVRFRAKLFCDATGDGWLGYYAGADYRMGREARSEYGEPMAPEAADGDTLGASIMWTSANANCDVPFSAPWAEKWAQGEEATEGEWFWEYGIHHDMISDAEWIRDRMMLAIYGAFSLAKRKAANSRKVIDFMPFVLGKRESRRLLGDWVYRETDISSRRPFEDAIASGSWSVDIHYDGRKPGVDYMSRNLHPLYGRYWIPYRSIYSRNVPNLFMAGRCFSCTHIGLGGPRVINTLGQLGCAAGEAAAMCMEIGCLPRAICEPGRMRELQRRLGGDFPGNPDPARSRWRIVDDDDASVRFEGKWAPAFCENGEQCGNRVHRPMGKGCRAIYQLPVDRAGLYRLHAKVPYSWFLVPGSPVNLELVSGGVRRVLEFDQAIGCGEWRSLGDFELSPGAQLTVVADGPTKYVVADGFAVEPVDRQGQ
jgi:hypothetical protein